MTRMLPVVFAAALAVAGTAAQIAPPRDLDGHFPFTPSASKEAWAPRAETLRRQVRVALGLWPWPTRTPLNAVIHGAVAREGYTVERVFFESMPGHFVTGSLYRPSGRTGRLPAVLSPHGHWPGGRFQDVPEPERRKQLASGAERFDNAARHILQARAVQLARMGAIVFLYDMIGYADSVQIPQAIAHSPRGRRRPESDDGLFFSLGAELRLQSILGLQMWNAVRALDFLMTLADVDPARIAVTGASGGGTQTFLLGAIDDRPAVAFPAVMVSTRMQGGCTCENANYLRIGTGNVELTALFAPKPLGMTAADDWTKTMPTDGFPELQAHYGLFGAKEKVALFPFLHFGHNYNHVSRTAMYGWLNRHLGLGFDEPVLESDFVPLTGEEATVWTAAHPAPAGGEDHERAVTTWWQADTDRQLALPKTAAEVESWRAVVGGAVKAVVGEPRPASPSTVTWSPNGEPRGVTVVTGSGGVAALGESDGPGALARALLAEGQTVVAVDVAGQPGGAAKNRLVANRNAAAYTFGYNAPLVVERARNVAAALKAARDAAGGRPVTLLALDGPASAWAVLAAVAGGSYDRAALVTEGFRFASVASMEDAAFLPGSVKYGDLPALLALMAPKPLWVAGERSDALTFPRGVYGASGAPGMLTMQQGRENRDLVRWISGRR